jgi:cyclophilin family peptidyl-prolyl cis-trans isomerase
MFRTRTFAAPTFALALTLLALSCLAAGVAGAAGGPRVTFETTQGSFVLELDRSSAPGTVENFLRYVRDGFYRGTVFHRVIPGFMIQGGGLTANLSEKATRPPIRNEADNGVSNARGTISMARTSVVDSATAQFFINTVDNGRSLDHRGTSPRDYGYAVFGRVTAGMDVVDAISGVSTGRQGPHQNVPVEPVVINAVTVQ